MCLPALAQPDLRSFLGEGMKGAGVNVVVGHISEELLPEVLEGELGIAL